MFPVILDVQRVGIALIGQGPHAQKRAQQMREAGATKLKVFEHVPQSSDLSGIQVVFAAYLSDEDMQQLGEICRSLNILLNIEDVRPHCDFHIPSLVRRGDLLLTVSTAGKSPGAAVALREWLERAVGPEWAGRLDELAKARDGWRAQGLAMPAVLQKTREMIARNRWLEG